MIEFSNEYHIFPKAVVWKYGLVSGFVCKISDGKTLIKSWPYQFEIDEYLAKQIIKEYQDYLLTIAYKDKRKKEYPPIEDQLDAIWKGGQDMEDMRAIILAIKNKYPKEV